MVSGTTSLHIESIGRSLLSLFFFLHNNSSRRCGPVQAILNRVNHTTDERAQYYHFVGMCLLDPLGRGYGPHMATSISLFPILVLAQTSVWWQKYCRYPIQRFKTRFHHRHLLELRPYNSNCQCIAALHTHRKKGQGRW